MSKLSKGGRSTHGFLKRRNPSSSPVGEAGTHHLLATVVRKECWKFCWKLAKYICISVGIYNEVISHQHIPKWVATQLLGNFTKCVGNHHFPDVFFSTSYIDTCLWVYTQNLGVCWTFAESTVNLWQKGRRKKTPLYLVSTPGPPGCWLVTTRMTDSFTTVIYHSYPLVGVGPKPLPTFTPLPLPPHFHHTTLQPHRFRYRCVLLYPVTTCLSKKKPFCKRAGGGEVPLINNDFCEVPKGSARGTARHGTWESMMMIFLSGLFPVL